MASQPENPIAAIISAIASLIGSIAWPLIAASLLLLLYRNSADIIANLNSFLAGKQSAEVALGPGGVSLKITAQEAAKALVASVEKSQKGPVDPSQREAINATAQSAAQLSLSGSTPNRRLKVLWVDDHPENNIELQFAFQAVGIIVISIDSNDGLQQAFQASGEFDAVISDMYRDAVANRREVQPEAGWQTVKWIAENHLNVPVIIYAGTYAYERRNDPVSAPVVKITNDPQQVFSIITQLATNKVLGK